jgi:hypothetical protein
LPAEMPSPENYCAAPRWDERGSAALEVDKDSRWGSR